MSEFPLYHTVKHTVIFDNRSHNHIHMHTYIYTLKHTHTHIQKKLSMGKCMFTKNQRLIKNIKEHKRYVLQGRILNQ